MGIPPAPPEWIPLDITEFPAIVQFVIVRMPLALLEIPPKLVLPLIDVFPTIKQFVRVILLSVELEIPPALPAIMLFVTEMFPSP